MNKLVHTFVLNDITSSESKNFLLRPVVYKLYEKNKVTKAHNICVKSRRIDKMKTKRFG